MVLRMLHAEDSQLLSLHFIAYHYHLITDAFSTMSVFTPRRKAGKAAEDSTVSDDDVIAGNLPLFLPPVQTQAHIPTYLHIHIGIPANIYSNSTPVHQRSANDLWEPQIHKSQDCPSFHMAKASFDTFSYLSRVRTFL